MNLDMGKDLSRKRIFNYVQADLPPDYFAIVRVEWHDEDGILQSVDEFKLSDAGPLTRDHFVKIAKRAMVDGADISMISSYGPDYIGLIEE